MPKIKQLKMMRSSKTLFEEASEWCKGRIFLFRFLLLLFLAFILLKYLTNPMYQSILKPLNLGIHELGHVVFAPFGKFIWILGGTLLQLLIPVFSIFMFYITQRDFFAIAVVFGWLSTNLFDVAGYMADARSMAIPLVSLSAGEIIHDWNYLFGKMGLLKFDTTIAMIVRVTAVFSMFICLIFGGWLLWRMFCFKEKS